MAQTPYIVTPGVVLRQTETKEADKILTLLTPTLGKISVIARGARRKSCKYAACAQALAYSEWTLYQKGDWYYANEASPLELFTGLQLDLTAMSLGFYMAELTEAVTYEEAESGEVLSLFLNALYALDKLEREPELVRAAFELKLMSLIGFEPLLEGCVHCGEAAPREPVLDLQGGVLRCRSCGMGSGRQALLSPGGISELRLVV